MAGQHLQGRNRECFIMWCWRGQEESVSRENRNIRVLQPTAIMTPLPTPPNSSCYCLFVCFYLFIFCFEGTFISTQECSSTPSKLRELYSEPGIKMACLHHSTLDLSSLSHPSHPHALNTLLPFPFTNVTGWPTWSHWSPTWNSAVELRWVVDIKGNREFWKFSTAFIS